MESDFLLALPWKRRPDAPWRDLEQPGCACPHHHHESKAVRPETRDIAAAAGAPGTSVGFMDAIALTHTSSL